MEKEIVIASFEEDTSWIPEDLYKYILLYSSGNPKKKIEDRFRFDDLERFNSVKGNYNHMGFMLGCPEVTNFV